MKHTIKAAAALAIASGAAQAGGLDKSGQKLDPFFEKGTYAEFAVVAARPSVDGTDPGSNPSGNVPNSSVTFSGAFKTDLGEQTSFALIYDKPFAADIGYLSGTGHALAGTTAELNAHALTGILRYKFDNNVSVYGGLRAQTLEATAHKIVNAGAVDYSVTAENDQAFGYVAGVAWENPKKAMRVSLTYNSTVKHKNATFEDLVAGPGAPASGNSTTEIETPQSVNLNLKTAVNRKTIVFAGARWVDWSSFEIAPAIHNGNLGGAFLSYDSDRITYNIGVGRAFSKKLSGSFAITYEPSNGQLTGNLGPVDGRTALTAGLRYKMDKSFIQAGATYALLGDATTKSIGSSFTDNTAFGVGIKFGRWF